MDERLAKIIEASQLQDVERHIEGVRRAAEMQAFNQWGFAAYCTLFVFGAFLLVAWSLWPKRRMLTLRGWRDEDDVGSGTGVRGGVAGETASAWRLKRVAPGFVGGVLLAILGAMSQQLSIDRNRGFIEDQQRRMNADLRRAMDRARQEYLREHPPTGERWNPELEREVKAAEDAARDNIVQSHYLYIPKGNSLRYLSLGNSSIAADYLWITSLQYVTSPFQQGHKFDFLHRFYAEILELDPHWIDIYVNMGKVLSALDPDRYRTQRFLDQCITRNPGDFQLPLQAGRLFVVPTVRRKQNQDYSRKASEYFEQAKSRQDLPKTDRAILEDLIGRLKREAGLHGAAAEQLWKIVNDPDVPKNLRENSSREWLQAESLVRADLFQQLVNAFKTRHGKLPQDLTIALMDFSAQPNARGPGWFKDGLNGANPLDAYGLPLLYDAATGEVASHGVHALNALRASRVIDSLIASVYSEPGRAFPRDLAELTQHIRRAFPTVDHAPLPVVDALGEELNAEKSPLGGPWNYDPNTGKITLPPECNPRELFRNADMTLDGRVPAYFKGAAGGQ
jgi:hypothetical protein